MMRERRGFDEREAGHVADVVMRWWHENGHGGVMAWVERDGTGPQGVWRVRSNLRNGLPPGADPVAIGRLYQHRWGGR